MSFTVNQRREIVSGIRRLTGFSESAAAAALEEGVRVTSGAPLSETGRRDRTVISEAQSRAGSGGSAVRDSEPAAMTESAYDVHSARVFGRRTGV